MVTRASAVLSAWYSYRPRSVDYEQSGALKVCARVELEPALDSSQIHPAWMPNRDVCIDGLQLLTGDAVRLEQFEHVDKSLAAAVESNLEVPFSLTGSLFLLITRITSRG